MHTTRNMHNMHASSKPVVILRLHHIFRHLDLLRPKPVQTLKYDDVYTPPAVFLRRIQLSR